MAWFNNLMSREEFSSSVKAIMEGKGIDSFKVIISQVFHEVWVDLR